MLFALLTRNQIKNPSRIAAEKFQDFEGLLTNRKIKIGIAVEYLHVNQCNLEHCAITITLFNIDMRSKSDNYRKK